MLLEGLGNRTGGEMAPTLAENGQKLLVTLCPDVLCGVYTRKVAVQCWGVALPPTHSPVL